ncbi:hypothetical protein [Haladaptatus halobius]|uniref:hypothetical protein n=1 Tax=Haladaptatus halobius TaxID=2884875 RepID=UPI001D0A39A8|nr:hypothetical protein [Haladaptatus halobius]
MVVSPPSLVEIDVIDDVDDSRDSVFCVVELCEVVDGEVVVNVVVVVMVGGVVVLVVNVVVVLVGGIVVLVVEPELHGRGLSLVMVEPNVLTLTLTISSPAYCPSP